MKLRSFSTSQLRIFTTSEVHSFTASIFKKRRNKNIMNNNLKRILLVEDNPNDVELTLAALAEQNLANEVIVIQDGAEALDYLYHRGKYQMRSPGNPAVILLDLKLPKVDGLAVLKTVKSDEQLKTIPVVILTSSREEKDLVRSYELGVNAYVTKPVDFSEFVKSVSLLGLFWAVINEPPVISIPKPQHRE
jgi:CheY-like chemotaxis protein